jgi:uncharacterized protein YndB with AHSA1/START domain
MNVEILNDTIVGEVVIEAPPEAVFEALLDPAQLSEWWGSPELYRTINWKSDPRPGGERSCDAKSADGTMGRVHGTYIEVDPPRSLAFTWNPSWDPGPETEIRILLEPAPGGTLLRLLHSGFGAGRDKSQQGHTQGWLRVLGWLSQHCQVKEKQG